MKTLDVVHKLQSEGHTISYYVRKDGGILIRSIDGVRYTGASGNAMAREMAQVSLSEARTKQVKYAMRQRKLKKPSLSDPMMQEYKRVKKIWNKTFKAKGGVAHSAGYFGWSRIKYAKEHYGEEEAMRRIKEAERYAEGIAYSKNVEILASFIEDAGNKLNSQELLDLAEDVRANAYSIKDEWIYPAYQELYSINIAKDPREIAKRVRGILRL